MCVCVSQVTRSTAPTIGWYRRIAEQAFNRYLDNCEALRVAAANELAVAPTAQRTSIMHPSASTGLISPVSSHLFV